IRRLSGDLTTSPNDRDKPGHDGVWALILAPMRPFPSLFAMTELRSGAGPHGNSAHSIGSPPAELAQRRDPAFTTDVSWEHPSQTAMSISLSKKPNCC